MRQVKLSLDKVILATGHTGTIGKHLPESIVKPNWNLLHPRSIRFPVSQNFDLIHLAGIVGESNVANDIALSIKLNIDATRDLGNKFFEFSTGRLIYISSSHVYGNVETLISEEDACNPISKYAEQKLRAETELVNIFKTVPSRLLILRVFSILDWGMPPGTLGNKIENIIHGSMSKIQNAADIRDFLTPKTVAHVIYKITKSYDCHGVINVCSGTGMSVGKAVEKFFELSGKKLPPSILIEENSKTPSIIGCNSKLLSLGDLELELSWKLFKQPNYSKNEN